MDALKVSVLRVVTSFHQGFKACLHQGANTAAQHTLLAKQVGFGFRFKGGFQNAGACAANAQRVSQSQLLSLAGGVLLHGNQARHAFALQIFAAHSVAGAFGRNHRHVHISRRLNQAKVDVEAVGKHQHIAGLQVGGNVFLIHFGLLFIVNQNHNNISLFGGFGRIINRKALSLRLGPGFAALVQTDNNLTTGIFQVFGVRMALGAIADNRNLLALQFCQITIFLIKNFPHSTKCLLKYIYCIFNHNRPTIQVIRRLAKDMTILANIAEPKPATEQPGISQTTSQSIKPFNTRAKTPNVKIVSGRAASCKTGLTLKFSTVKSSAASSNESRLPNCRPLTIRSASSIARAFISATISNR